MDPATLAASVLAALTPYLAKGAKQVLDAAGEVALDKLKDLLSAVRKKFSSDGEAAEDFEKFEGNPERYRPVIEDILQEKLAEDADFAARTSDLVNEIGLDVIQIIDEATGVTGIVAKKLRKGKVRVIQRIAKGEDVTGADIDEIG